MVKLSEIRVDEALEATLKGLGVAAAVIGPACAESAAEGAIHVFVGTIFSHVAPSSSPRELEEMREPEEKHTSTRNQRLATLGVVWRQRRRPSPPE